MAKKRSRPTIKLPPDWRESFRGSTMRTSFSLNLTQPMIEFLCAVADTVQWDRALYFQTGGLARPDNFIASSRSLEKRGLIYVDDAALEEFRSSRSNETWEEMNQRTKWRLTPAGEALVQLLKITGIFVEADAAIIKKARRG